MPIAGAMRLGMVDRAFWKQTWSARCGCVWLSYTWRWSITFKLQLWAGDGTIPVSVMTIRPTTHTCIHIHKREREREREKEREGARVEVNC